MDDAGPLSGGELLAVREVVPAVRKRVTARAKAKPAAKRAAGRGSRAKAKPRTQVRWSVKRQELFLATLAETACVAQAIRASGLSETNVYRRRRADEDFRTAWQGALREGYAKLEAMLLERALNGVEKPVWHGGKQVGTIREYNDRLAMTLLAAHRPAVMGEAVASAVRSEEELRAALAARLGEMNVRMGGEG